MRVLLDSDEVARGLRRVAGEILERHRGTDGLVVVGIRRGGEIVARELLRRGGGNEGGGVATGRGATCPWEASTSRCIGMTPPLPCRIRGFRRARCRATSRTRRSSSSTTCS